MRSIKARSLKHYDLYVKCIQLYCKAIRIKLEWSNYDGNGAYVPDKRLIRIDPELSESETIGTLLHELGHVLDDTLINKKTFREMNRAYPSLYKNRYTEKQRQIVIRSETRAWHYGRVIAKILGIRLGRWYDTLRRDCLKGYKNQ